MVRIDGSQGEGGGQVLRTSLALSACTGTPVRIEAIRAGRKKPGLMAQHLAATLAVRDTCGARCVGAALGSQTLEFHPGPVRPGRFKSEVGTAGATTLVAQAALPPLRSADGPSELAVVGGTHVAWSPPFEHLSEVLLPTLRLMGWRAEAQLVEHGFYPRGGGEFKLQVEGTCPTGEPPVPLVFERPPRNHLRIHLHAVVCDLPRTIAERMIKTAASLLRAKRWRVREQISEGSAPHQGTYLFIRVWSHDDPPANGGSYVAGGFTGLGKIRKPAEEVAQEAAQEALVFLDGKAALDERLADQVLVPAAVSGIELRYRTGRISQHLRTQASIIEQFGIAGVQIEEDEQGGHVRLLPLRG